MWFYLLIHTWHISLIVILSWWNFPYSCWVGLYLVVITFKFFHEVINLFWYIFLCLRILNMHYFVQVMLCLLSSYWFCFSSTTNPPFWIPIHIVNPERPTECAVFNVKAGNLCYQLLVFRTFAMFSLCSIIKKLSNEYMWSYIITDLLRIVSQTWRR